MNVEFRNPDGLNKPVPYSHTVIIEASKIAFISGQIAVDENNKLVGPNDFRAQAEQVFRNLNAVVRGVGATMTDIVKITIYIPNYDSTAHYEVLRKVRKEHFGEHAPVSTLIGVQSLVGEEFLLEIDAVVVIA